MSAMGRQEMPEIIQEITHNNKRNKFFLVVGELTGQPRLNVVNDLGDKKIILRSL